jgi:hypothetical protein
MCYVCIIHNLNIAISVFDHYIKFPIKLYIELPVAILFYIIWIKITFQRKIFCYFARNLDTRFYVGNNHLTILLFLKSQGCEFCQKYRICVFRNQNFEQFSRIAISNCFLMSNSGLAEQILALLQAKQGSNK